MNRPLWRLGFEKLYTYALLLRIGVSPRDAYNAARIARPAGCETCARSGAMPNWPDSMKVEV